jgi:hypothetical protein
LHKLIWHLFGKKYETQRFIALQWPEYERGHPELRHCSMSLSTTAKQKIVVSLERPTIESPIGANALVWR